MQNKDRLRKKYFFIRKRKYFDIKPSFFNPLIQLINETYKKKYKAPRKKTPTAQHSTTSKRK